MQHLIDFASCVGGGHESDLEIALGTAAQPANSVVY